MSHFSIQPRSIWLLGGLLLLLGLAASTVTTTSARATAYLASQSSYVKLGNAALHSEPGVGRMPGTSLLPAEAVSAVLTLTLQSPLTITILPEGASDTVATPPSPPAPITVTTRLDVDATTATYPIVTSTFSISLPASRPEVATLLRHTRNDENYLAALKDILPGSWHESFSRIAPPVISVDQNVATVTITNTNALYSYPRTIMPWYISSSESEVFFEISGRDALTTAEWLTPTTWIIDMQLIGMRVISASPSPSILNEQGSVSWNLSENAIDQDVTVRGHLTSDLSLTVLRSLVDQSMWSFLHLLVSYAIPTVILFSTFRILAAKGAEKKKNTRDVVTPARKSLRWMLLVLMLLPAEGLLYYGLWIFAYPLIISSSAPGSGFYDETVRNSVLLLGFKNSILLLTSAFFFSLASVLFWRKINRKLPLVYRLLIGLTTLASLTVLNLPSAFSSIAYFMSSSAPNDNKLWEWFDQPWWLLLVGLVFLCLVYFVLAGLVRFAIALAPHPVAAKVIKIDPARGARYQWWLNAIPALLALLTFAQWVRLEYRRSKIWSAPETVFNTSTFGSSEWFESVIASLGSYPFSLFAQLIAFLPYIALFGLLRVLYIQASQSPNVLLFSADRWALASMALLFATFVVGTDGQLFGFGVPLAFIAALFLMNKLFTRRFRAVERVISSILAHNPGLTQEDLFARRAALVSEFLERAKAIRGLENKEATQYKEFSEGKKDAGESSREYQAIEQEIEALRRGTTRRTRWLRLPHMAPSRLSPHRLGLALGPRNTWWENGQLAVTIGWKLALFPIVFYIYVLLTQGGVEAFSSSTMAVFQIARGVLDEIAFWLVAAFIMGCLYAYLPTYLPWNNGALKGVALAGVYGLSLGFDALIHAWTGQALSTSWFFRTLELVVFLVALGVLMDVTTVREKGYYWRHIFDFYPLRDARFILGYLSPLAIVLITVGQQLLSGQAQEAIVELIKTLPATIPTLGPS